ncbi:PDR/VanB family oxidoreductase [Hoeflea sp. CAU 1731]
MAMKLFQKARVVSACIETPRVRKIVLEHALRKTLQPFDPGAHITVALPDNIRRQYSLCGDPKDQSHYCLGVLLEDLSRGGSRAMHALRPGDTVFVSYPANSFALCSDAEHHVFLAGGIGVTPILSMLFKLSSERASYEVHYGARSRTELGFLDTLEALCPANGLHVYSEDQPTAQRPDFQKILNGLGARSHVYICGPAPMLAALRSAANDVGVPCQQIHTEQFAALAANERRGEPFEMEVADTGETLPVGADQSALEVLRSAGYSIPSSCEGGICGECRIDLLGGAAIHRDRVLSDDERQTSFISCISRATGRISIQLPPQPKIIKKKEKSV